MVAMVFTRSLGGKCPFPGTLGIRNLARPCLIVYVWESNTLESDLIASEWEYHSTCKEGIVLPLDRDWGQCRVHT